MTDKGTVVSLFLFSSLLDSVPSFVHPSPCFRPSSAPVTVPTGFCSALPPLSRFDAAPVRGWFLQPALRLLFVFESLRSALGGLAGTLRAARNSPATSGPISNPASGRTDIDGPQRPSVRFRCPCRTSKCLNAFRSSKCLEAIRATQSVVAKIYHIDCLMIIKKMSFLDKTPVWGVAHRFGAFRRRRWFRWG